MSTYYVNKESTYPSSGEHEVHKEGCFRMPTNRLHIGEFNNEHEAVQACQNASPTLKIDGCWHCCPNAHTL